MIGPEPCSGTSHWSFSLIGPFPTVFGATHSARNFKETSIDTIRRIYGALPAMTMHEADIRLSDEGRQHRLGYHDPSFQKSTTRAARLQRALF